MRIVNSVLIGGTVTLAWISLDILAVWTGLWKPVGHSFVVFGAPYTGAYVALAPKGEKVTTVTRGGSNGANT